MLLYDIEIPIAKVPVISTDSRNAMIAAESDRRNMSTRHTDVKYIWVKEKIKNGELTLDWIASRNMKADGLTKPLNPTKQAEFVRLIGLTEVIATQEKNKNDETKNSIDRHTECSALRKKKILRRRESEYAGCLCPPEQQTTRKSTVLQKKFVHDQREKKRDCLDAICRYSYRKYPREVELFLISNPRDTRNFSLQ